MKSKSRLLVAGTIATLCLGGGNLLAQDDNGWPGGPPPGEPGGGPGGGGPGNMGDNNGPGGNFDPAQFQQRMLERTRENLSITNDDEWTAIQPLVQKVMEARREANSGGGMGLGPGGFGGPGNRSGGQSQNRPGPQASAEQQALQKVLDDGAPAAQVRDALAKYRAARKDKQAKLEAAQNNLKAVLNTHQEAHAVLLGLLP